MAVGSIGYFSENDSLSRKQTFMRAANGDADALALYLLSNDNINAKDEDGMALIHYAACFGNVPLIHTLRQHGANVSLLDNGSPPWKPIHYAIFHSKPDAENVLTKLGAEAPLPILKRITLEKPQELQPRNTSAAQFSRR